MGLLADHYTYIPRNFVALGITSGSNSAFKDFYFFKYPHMAHSFNYREVWTSIYFFMTPALSTNQTPALIHRVGMIFYQTIQLHVPLFGLTSLYSAPSAIL